MKDKFTIGIDFGTDSVRALVVNTRDGSEAGTAVFYYPRWQEGKYCDPQINMFRQHPLDYLEGLEYVIKESISGLNEKQRGKIAAISVDTTGSTPVPVDKNGTPLSLLPEYENNPNAMFILWKDHTAVKEADEINKRAHGWGGIDFTQYEGGIYSSEWFWAKILHILREDESVRDAAYSWVEHCDWIPALLTGDTDPAKLKRSRCAAGHKAMWHKDFEGLPSEEFLSGLDPLLSGLRERLFEKTYTCDIPAGKISHEWAGKFGLNSEVIIGTGAFDAHLGAIGGEIRPGYLSKVMGTSTCDMLIAEEDEIGDNLVRGICGQVDGSIIPGKVGLEAGQSAFGDIYAWFSDLLLWPVRNIINDLPWLTAEVRERIEIETREHILNKLGESAARIDPAESSEIAIDWMNGRRTPDANQELKGAIAGISLGTDAPAIFRTLVEATAFGSRLINERFIEEGINIEGIIALGGVAKKSPFVMQIVADILNMPIMVARSEQTCALGSAMAASVAAGIHRDIYAAQKAMGGGIEAEYYPDSERSRVYDSLYMKYKRLGAFLEKGL